MEDVKKKKTVKKSKVKEKTTKKVDRITDFWRKHPNGVVEILDMEAVLQ